MVTGLSSHGNGFDDEQQLMEANAGTRLTGLELPTYQLIDDLNLTLTILINISAMLYHIITNH